MKQPTVKQIQTYFIQGFHLANRNLDLWAILLLFGAHNLYGYFNPQAFTSTVNAVLSGILNIIGLVFALSLPAFFVHRQKGQMRDYKEIAMITLMNMKRIILPGIGMLLLLIILLIAVFISVGIFLAITNRLIQNLPDPHYFLIAIIFLILVIFLALLEFTGVYFSVEHMGLFKAIKTSVKASMKNLRYIIIVLGAYSFALLAGTSLPSDYPIVQAVFHILHNYVFFVIAATTLIYYQSVINSSSES